MHAVSSEFILSYCSYHIIIFILSYLHFYLVNTKQKLACSSEPAFSQELTALLYVISLLCCVALKQSHAFIPPAWSVTPKDDFWMSPFRGFPGTSKLGETPGQTQIPLEDLEDVAERTDRQTAASVTWAQISLQKWINRWRDGGIHPDIYHGCLTEEFFMHFKLFMSWAAIARWTMKMVTETFLNFYTPGRPITSHKPLDDPIR